MSNSFSLNKNIYFKQKYASLAFGNIVALTVDSVNIRATCASALPTRSRSSRGPLISYKNIYKYFKVYIVGYAELAFIIQVLVYYTLTHASMDSVL